MKLAIIICTLFLITLSSADDIEDLQVLIDRLMSNTGRLRAINDWTYPLPKNNLLNGRFILKTSTNDAQLATLKIVSYTAATRLAKLQLAIPSLTHSGAYANELSLLNSSVVVKDNSSLNAVFKNVTLYITANIDETHVWNTSVAGTIGSANGTIRGLMNDVVISALAEQSFNDLPNLVNLHPDIFTSAVSPLVETCINSLY